MTILVTGAAGFIGYHVTQQLLARNEPVIGIDNLNPYYDVHLKEARLAQLQAHKNFQFYATDIVNEEALKELIQKHPEIDRIIHLSAQAGVRYSLVNPGAYTKANVVGHLNILEAARSLAVKHLVYASSSSVYGANQKLPFSIQDAVDQPMSIYAATKRSCELMSYTYSHLYAIPISGLRFFTVYGPWGRPDMAAHIFTKAIFAGDEIALYNQGNMRRNFTYIDDVVLGTIHCMDAPPFIRNNENDVPHRVYNIGNSRSELLTDFVKRLEKIIGKEAKIRFEALQPGDVIETIADIQESTKAFGFLPKTNIQEGLHNFVTWYRSFYDVK